MRSAAREANRRDRRDPELKRVLFVRNAAASRGSADLDDALAYVRELGLEVDERIPDDAEHMRFLIRAVARSIDAVLVGGGDGTVNSALKPVLEAGLPLGVIPLGTANDFARTLGIPADPYEAFAVVAAQSTRLVDVGWANNRPFLNAAGIGLSARIARDLDSVRKRVWGPLSYPLAVLESLRRQRAFRVRLQSPAGTQEFSSIQVTVGNGVYYGGGARVATDCAIDDGCLDVLSIRPQPLRRLLAVALALRNGSQASGFDVAAGAVFEVATQPPLTVTLDGEPALPTPVSFRVAPRALRVFVPGPGSIRGG
ncbi:MAG: lipid kinase [Pseudomonadales bacterium]